MLYTVFDSIVEEVIQKWRKITIKRFIICALHWMLLC